MKSIALLGITGSIGRSTIAVCRAHKDLFRINIASAHRNYKELFQLAQEFKIKTVILTDESMKNKITDIPKNVSVYYGNKSLTSILSEVNYDVLLNAIAGSPGLPFTMIALRRGIDVALANKESLVMAGHLINDILKTSKAKLLPVDSEHSAVLQALGNHHIDTVEKIILTASGGPFRSLPLNEFKDITLQKALKHPTWSMGSKITIDSATMMNKGLEVIEAHWLFNASYDKIDAIIHPQSIIHSLVEFTDGSMISQMSNPSMTLPILFALTYPKHQASPIHKTNLLELNALTFEKICTKRYPLFGLANNVGRKAGILPTVMNAANEAAVHRFLEEQISYTELIDLVIEYVENYENKINPSLEEILETNFAVYKTVYNDYKSILRR